MMELDVKNIVWSTEDPFEAKDCFILLLGKKF